MTTLTKRDFLKALVALASPFAADRARAVGILEHLQSEKPNYYEQDLMKNPRRQILIAEKSGCPNSGSYKMKCHQEVDG